MIKIINEAASKKQMRQEIVDTFLNTVKINLNAYNPTDMEIEIPAAIDDDEMWNLLWSTAEDHGISYTVDEVDKKHDPHYYYMYIRKRHSYDLDDDFERYTYVKSKDVNDSDGFRTEYTMYYDEVEDRYVFVFGDSDLYNPNDDYEEFDYECDTEQEANEWFDDYKGFEDLDENLKESTNLKKGNVIERG